MDPFEQEPVAPPGDSVLAPVRIAAIAAAALPAVGFGLLCLFQGVAEYAAAPEECVSRLVLGSALLVLFADVAVVINRSRRLEMVLLAGVFGFAGAFMAVKLAEVGGPPVLAALAAIAALWALAIVRRRRVGRT